VAGLIENVYSKFKLMLLKRDEPSKNSLVAQLTRINDHLESTGNRFLTGKIILYQRLSRFSRGNRCLTPLSRSTLYWYRYLMLYSDNVPVHSRQVKSFC
jgi:hypothetical protein